MATADTARLIAALELQDKFSGPIGGAEKKLGGFEKRMSGINRSAQTMSRGVGTAFSTISRVAVGGAVAGIGLLALNVKSGVDSLNELQSANTATNTVLKSTKGVSGQTAEGIRDMSEEFENLNATMDDKVIQSGANMLLTFTNVREKAFEPALEAALNMNEAMGGGQEGLQSTIIQVGKALNDPIKGVTALRRVGVQLNDQQEEQIKRLVEQNDLYGAQQIILDELATQFGGRFAAAGRDEIGRQAALADRIEDVQKALAGPLLPAITRAREKLIDLLGSERILSGADRLGRALAGLFSDQNLDRGVAAIERGIDALSRGDFSGITGNLGNIASTVGGLPWDSIADAARLLGTGSKALLDAFLGLPGWVQTAVLTGWGLNKLTGGALGSIVGELGKGLVKGVLGMNAGVVNINAATVNGGGGVPGVAGRGGGFLGGLGRGLATGAAVGGGLALAGVAAVEVVNFQNMRTEATANLETILDNMPHRTGAEIDESISRIEGEINKERPFLEGILFNTNVKPQLEAQVAELQEVKSAQARSEAAFRDAIPWQQRNVSEIQNLNMSEGTRFSNLSALTAGQNATLGQIRDKPSTVNVNVPVNVQVGVGEIAYRVQSLRQTIGGGGFI